MAIEYLHPEVLYSQLIICNIKQTTLQNVLSNNHKSNYIIYTNTISNIKLTNIIKLIRLKFETVRKEFIILSMQCGDQLNPWCHSSVTLVFQMQVDPSQSHQVSCRLRALVLSLVLA